jgi:hypothetical protein
MMASYSAILAQTTVQQGDFVKYQDTLGNQLKTISTEFDNLSKDIGLMLIPAITEAMPQIKEMARGLGEELKAAIQSVDWTALTKTIVDLARFFAQNAETILKVVVAIFALNTAYKLMTVASGLVSVALEVQKWWLAQTATGMTTATIATNLLSSAMRLIPFVAVVAGIALIATEIANSGPKFDAYREHFEQLDTSVTNINPNMSAFALTALDIQAKYLPVVKLLRDLAVAMGLIPKEIKTTIKVDVELERNARNTELNNYLGFLGSRSGGTTTGATPTPTPTPSAGSSVAQAMSPLQQLLSEPARNIKADKQAVKLEGAGLSKEVARWITSVDKPVIAAREAMTRIDKRGSTAIAKLTRDYQNSSTGRAAAAAQAAADDAAAIASSQALIAAQQAAAAAEAAAVAERERVYNSFLDSVKSTFAGIKNAILGAFDLPQLGGSTNAITRNMDKLLVRLRAFANNVKQLSGMGLNPALLQQVISAGPMAGARLAESLVMGGAGALAAINAGYSEFGALSSQIAETGTNSLFNREAQQTVYNINVDGGVGSGSTIGKAIVDAIKAYERTSGAVWQGA